MSDYKCPKCNKIIKRNGSKKWIASVCTTTGERTRLQLIKPKQR